MEVVVLLLVVEIAKLIIKEIVFAFFWLLEEIELVIFGLFLGLFLLKVVPILLGLRSVFDLFFVVV